MGFLSLAFFGKQKKPPIDIYCSRSFLLLPAPEFEQDKPRDLRFRNTRADNMLAVAASAPLTPPSSPAALRKAAQCLAPSRRGVVARLEAYKEEERASLRQTAAEVQARLQAVPYVLPPHVDTTRIAEIAATQACVVPCYSVGCRFTVEHVDTINPASWVCVDCAIARL